MSSTPITDMYEDDDFDAEDHTGRFEAFDSAEATALDLGADQDLEECTCGACPLCSDDGSDVE
jgi:hypothetical protein